MSRAKTENVAIADRQYNGPLNFPGSAWSSGDITAEQTALSDESVGIVARIVFATGNYVKVKWTWNGKHLASYKSRDYDREDALAYLEEVKNKYDVWSTLGVDEIDTSELTGTAALAPAATSQLTFTITKFDESTENVTSASTFSSSDTEVATVSPTGLVTAVADGTATITAQYRDEIDTILITVTTP